jgi:hypothetical protein
MVGKGKQVRKFFDLLRSRLAEAVSRFELEAQQDWIFTPSSRLQCRREFHAVHGHNPVVTFGGQDDNRWVDQRIRALRCANPVKEDLIAAVGVLRWNSALFGVAIVVEA